MAAVKRRQGDGYQRPRLSVSFSASSRVTLYGILQISSLLFFSFLFFPFFFSSPYLAGSAPLSGSRSR